MKTIKFELNDYDKNLFGNLTLFLVNEDASSPLVIDVPGGGYSHIGTREGMPVVNKLIENNVNVALLAYSVYPIHYPVQENEINKSIEICRNFSKNIYLLGFSAGAHLTLLAYTDPKNDDIKGEIAIYPVVSFKNNPHEGSRKCLLNNELSKKNLDNYSIENRIKENLAPVLIFVSKNDQCVNPTNSILLAEALTKNNIKNKLTMYEDAPHGFALADETAIKDNDTSYVKKDVSKWFYEALNFIKTGNF